MKTTLKTGALYLGQIILTAIASALIALLQNYVASHTGVPAEHISPEKTSLIGTTLGTARVSYIHIKNNFL